MLRLLVCAFLMPSAPSFAQALFTRITDGPIATDAVRSWGCALVDYDNDGLTDVFVATAFGETNCLYRNLGSFQFTKATTEPVVTTFGDFCTGVFGDCDNDGDLDLFASGFDPYKGCFFRNDLGTGSSMVFTGITSGAWVNTIAQSVGAAWADYDNDGFLDLFLSNTGDQNNFLYRNDGSEQMIAVTDGPVVTSGGMSQGCAWGDFDGDGRPDLYVANSLGQTNFLFHNVGQGAFNRPTDGPPVIEGGIWLSPAWADYDNDGHLDLFVANGASRDDALYHNNGDGTFTPVADDPIVSSGGTSEGGTWGDYDNDGYLDLFVANNWGQPDFLFHNERDGSFTRIYDGEIVNDTARGIGCAWADLDNDGFLDLFVSNGPEGPTRPGEVNFCYRNDARTNGNTNAWLLVRLIGTASNRSAIGAKVRARATLWGKEVWQMREISGGSGMCSQNDLRAHFGLGDATKVDTLRIEWPSGIVQELKDVAPNQILTVTEPARLIPQSVGAFKIQCWINQTFDVQASTDLVNWATVATVTNLTGTLVFEDLEADQHDCRYYRVLEARPNMVWIPPGTFLMGSPEDEVDRQENEGPQTQVTLTKGFWMGKYEVTQGEYLEVMGNNPSWFNGDRTSEDGADYGTDLTRPVEQVSWYDATNYCAQLTERERSAGRIPTNCVYRLPTEAEWEYACRAWTSTRFSYGDDPGYTNLTNYAWHYDNSGGGTHPVGRKLPNPWGLYDMHGNVWEWCQDSLGDYPGGLAVDPQGTSEGSRPVVRGGGWGGRVVWDFPWFCRSAVRYGTYRALGYWAYFIGFRVVLAPVQR